MVKLQIEFHISIINSHTCTKTDLSKMFNLAKIDESTCAFDDQTNAKISSLVYHPSTLAMSQRTSLDHVWGVRRDT